MATINAIAFSAGRARVDFGHFRTNKAWTRWWFVNQTSLAPGSDMTHFESRRQSNHDPNTGIVFDDSTNGLDLEQNTIAIGEISGLTAGDWYLVVESCDGSQNVTWAIIDPSDGSVIDTDTVATASSYAHSQPQYTYYGQSYNGTTGTRSFVGAGCLMGAIKGAEIAVSGTYGLAAFAQDPLNVGDVWLQTYVGTDAEWQASDTPTMYFIDDTESDVGPNGVTLTLASVSWGSGNGPTVTDRSAPSGTAPTIAELPEFDIVYEQQQRVTFAVTDAGTDTPLVFIAAGPDDISGDFQEVDSSSDTSITLKEIALSTITPGQTCYINVTNQTPADASYGLTGQRQIRVEAAPAAATVARRFSSTGVTVESGVAISTIDTAAYFHATDAQGVLTFSATGLPTGLSIDSSTGIVSGTPSAAGTYSVVIRATDPNGDYVETSFSWLIGASTVTTRSSGSWGRAGRRAA